MLRATADTNVIVSGLTFSGNPRRILNLAESGTIRLAVSDAILEEVEDVLRRISRFTDYVEPTLSIDVIKDDPDDNRILECSAAAESDYIISGDKHLLSLERFGNAKILKPVNFLKAILGHNGSV